MGPVTAAPVFFWGVSSPFMLPLGPLEITGGGSRGRSQSKNPPPGGASHCRGRVGDGILRQVLGQKGGVFGNAAEPGSEGGVLEPLFLSRCPMGWRWGLPQRGGAPFWDAVGCSPMFPAPLHPLTLGSAPARSL